MECWQDQGIVLRARAHGEHGAIVSLLTAHHGRAAGYVRGGQGTKLRGSLEVGNLVDVTWQSRTHDGLGAFTLELSKNVSAHLLQEPLKLAALQSACALCDAALPEREAHAGLYHGLQALFETLESDVWGAAYVLWEIALLKELGFSLDLTRCASGNGDENLMYVSPKTGKAVSASAGAPYKGKLLALAGFLKPGGGEMNEKEVMKGLEMTGHFLDTYVFTHHSRGVPDARLIFAQRFAKTLDMQSIGKNEYAAG
ncbi:MAG TPA: DNA repair protein RecO [Alphaproteobacteria bacterium]|nr:DNA repair protein RecO [Alphaproteobacteria bacterium]USO06048.1 MAG: DNA repair protein RecO [Rhodospirillales bacterium]HOO81355.1 DNA repair protein RecO [Alphaproteobacteria bacterium]